MYLFFDKLSTRLRRRLPTGSRRRHERGMTLIEILVVMGLLGLMLSMASASLGTASQAEVVRSTNQLASTIRFAYDRARTTGTQYRLLIDFEKRSFSLQEADQRMYLPATDLEGKPIILDERQLEERARRDEQAEEAYNQSLVSQIEGQDLYGEDELDPYAVGPRKVPRRKPPMFSGFEGDNVLNELGEPVVFGEDVKILSVQTDADLEPITSGQASLFFFPRGQTQLAHIQLEDEDGENAYTIKVQPLTGKVTVLPEKEDLPTPKTLYEMEDDLGEKIERRAF